MRELIAPVLKADFKLVDDYAVDPPAEPLLVPLRVLAGERDTFTSDELVTEWADYTAAGCSVHRMAGGHFFHQEQRTEVMARLAAWADEIERR